jgi:rhodanese-related sulfurtransferase
VSTRSGIAIIYQESVMSITTITPKKLSDLIHSGAAVELIDVRTPVEYREVHVSPARNVPLDQLNAVQFAAGRRGSEPLYVICRSGNRAKQACEKFLAAGYPNVVNVDGGTQAWDQAGLAVVRGKKAISLERQVRIAAGLLVLTGSALGYFVNPYWIGLSASAWVQLRISVFRGRGGSSRRPIAGCT